MPSNRQKRRPMTPEHPRWVEFIARLERSLIGQGVFAACTGSVNRSRQILVELGFDPLSSAISLRQLEKRGMGCDCQIIQHAIISAEQATETLGVPYPFITRAIRVGIAEPSERSRVKKLPACQRPKVHLQWQVDGGNLALRDDKGDTYGHIERLGQRYRWICYRTVNDPEYFGEGLEENLSDACICLTSDLATLLASDGLLVQHTLACPWRETNQT
jgi:hypothetical protein